MSQMKSDACCSRAGWLEYIATCTSQDAHVSIAPDQEIKGTFPCFDHDMQTMIMITGEAWKFTRIYN